MRSIRATNGLGYRLICALSVYSSAQNRAFSSALVDAAGCRGLTVGGAQVSEKHTNFLINTGTATSADIEALGEEVRARVKAHSGVELEWEIQRVGKAA